VKLKEFCFSILFKRAWMPNGWLGEGAVRSLGGIRDPRALAGLHSLCTFIENVDHGYTLIRTLGERGDPSSIPFLEKIPQSKKDANPSVSIEVYRLQAIERIRLLEKYGEKLKGKPLLPDQQTQFMKCLDSPKCVEEFTADMRKHENYWTLLGQLQVAGYLDQESVRSCLKQIASDKSLDDRATTLVHGALAQLGEKNSIDELNRRLVHQNPGVRLAAAESLWHLSSREGLRTLLEILDLRPIETGGEGTKVGGGAIIKVTALDGTNLEQIRAACKILGEMGDQSAINPLKRLLPLNLNGIVATGGSGFGWSGRPDIVALARLGDFSGIAVLRESIGKGDPLGAAGSLGRIGDLTEIGEQRYIPDVLPLLDHRDENKRVNAAQTILLLLEK
jgi:HEAT repeat protein